jgi:hypothetical protein
MKKIKIKLIAVAVAMLVGSAATSRAAITLGFASTSGSSGDTVGSLIQFNSGGTFQFVPGNLTGADFVINSSSITGPGAGLGDLGLINGLFTIGAITTSGTTQTAPVTSSLGSTVTINDGALNTLTAGLTWNLIATMGTGGIINVGGVVNLTGITYTGTQAALVALAAQGNAIDTVSFTFIPGENLTQLTSIPVGSSLSTTFSGTIASPAPVPEPATLVAGLLVLLPAGASTLQILSKKRAA